MRLPVSVDAVTESRDKYVPYVCKRAHSHPHNSQASISCARTQKRRRRVRCSDGWVCACPRWLCVVHVKQSCIRRFCVCTLTSRSDTYRCIGFVVRRTPSADNYTPNIFQYSVSLLLSVVRSCWVCVAPIHFYNSYKRRSEEKKEVVFYGVPSNQKMNTDFIWTTLL